MPLGRAGGSSSPPGIPQPAGASVLSRSPEATARSAALPPLPSLQVVRAHRPGRKLLLLPAAPWHMVQTFI